MESRAPAGRVGDLAQVTGEPVAEDHRRSTSGRQQGQADLRIR